jgi:guanosine-3',5'-bis(diphosphate) 3'-pyrophosphohydrolase
MAASGTSADGLGLVLKALAFAAEKHRSQRRKDAEASPYINHPIALATVLFHEAHVQDPIVLAAAILHDTVEDTETTVEELRREFGEQVTAIVEEVTDDKRLPKAERKQKQNEHAPHISDAAQQVKLADKISNLRDLVESPPANWSLDRKREYFEWARSVIDGFRGKHPELEAIFDRVYQRKP